MRLEWIRSKSEIKEVLLEPKANGPEIAYWLFSDLSDDINHTNTAPSTTHKWQNMTIVTPGFYGKEFPKTYGHYHPPRTLETYRLTAGEGIILLQKKCFEKNIWQQEKVEEVYMVKLLPKEEVTIPYDFGHSWSNVGQTPLITFDDWDSGHTVHDYEVIKRLRGMCFYVVNDGGIKFVPNSKYKNHPEPKVVTAKEFQRLYPVA